MKVVFDERAAADLEDIYRFIATDNPRNAQSVVDRIVASVERLGQFPEMARAGQVDGTREWVVPRSFHLLSSIGYRGTAMKSS